MNKKIYIGENAKSFSGLGLTEPIGGVLLKVDGETAYRAGDQTGYVLEAECPYGTQAMADALLESLQGRSYEGFEAEGAKLPVGAELGDGVTVKGLYGPLYRRRVRFGAELAADIGAPAGGDTDHEFGYTDPVQRQIELASARTRSYIEKKADEIRIGVEEDVDGKLAEVDVTLEGITSTVKGQGESISTLQQTANSLTAEINGENGVKGQLSLKVDKTDNNQVVSMLNIATDKLNIKNNRFVLDSTNFKVSADGTITARNGQFSGKVTSSGEWSDGVHTLTIDDSRIEISIGSRRNLYVNQTAGEGGSVGGSYISVYHGNNDNGVLLDDEARRTDVVGGYINVGVDKNGTAKGWVSCGSLTSEGAISAGGNVSAEGAISAGGSISAGGNVTATCGKRKLSLTSGPGDTYEGLYSPDLGQWLLTIDENKAVRLLGSAEKLATAQNINGVPFDGTQSITVYDNTKLPTDRIRFSHNLVPVSGGQGTLDIKFTPPMPSQPEVFVTANAGSPGTGVHEVTATNVSASGFTICVGRTGDYATTVHWFAICA